LSFFGFEIKFYFSSGKQYSSQETGPSLFVPADFFPFPFLTPRVQPFRCTHFVIVPSCINQFLLMLPMHPLFKKAKPIGDHSEVTMPGMHRRRIFTGHRFAVMLFHLYLIVLLRMFQDWGCSLVRFHHAIVSMVC